MPAKATSFIHRFPLRAMASDIENGFGCTVRLRLRWWEVMRLVVVHGQVPDLLRASGMLVVGVGWGCGGSRAVDAAFGIFAACFTGRRMSRGCAAVMLDCVTLLLRCSISTH